VILDWFSSKYGMAITELAEMNDFKQNAQLRIGDVIKVPNCNCNG
jgi:LysM repeat protein